MTDKIDDGGPAYPVEMQYYDGQPTKGLQTSGHSGWETGMSLRDWFAGQAMNGQLSGFWTSETPHGWSFEEIAREAYAVADAMISARNGGAS